MQRNIDSIVLANYIKYERLSSLINYAYTGSNATEINLFLDLYPIIRSIYADTYQVSYHGFMDLVPLLINLCIHYRFFFKKFYGVYATIYIISGRNRPEVNKMLVPEYNYVMQKREVAPTHSVMDEMLSKNFKILSILAPYLPGIHYIDTQFETGVVIGHIIDTKKDNNPNIVISKDIYPLQLAANDRFLNTAFLKPFKMSSGEDLSVLIQSAEYMNWTDFWSFVCKERNSNLPGEIMIHPSNIAPIMSISGIPERSIKSLMQFRSVYRMICQIIGTAAIECSIDSIYSTFDIEANIPRHIIDNRFHTIDIPYQIDSLYSSSSEALLLKFENKYDPGTVKAICDKYFNNIPIMLDKL